MGGTAMQSWHYSARRWLAAQIRALRAALGLSRAAFARKLGVDEKTVARWEDGIQSPTRIHVLEALDRLERNLTPAQRRRFAQELPADQRMPCDEVLLSDPVLVCPHCAADMLKGNGATMRRRDILELFAELLAGGAAAGLGTRSRPASASEPVTASLVAAREQIMRGFAAAYIVGDAGDLLPAVAGFADGLAPLLRRVPTYDLGLRLATVLVDAHGMAGSLASHVGHPVLTQRHLAQASHVADASRDPVLRARAWALEVKHLYSPLLDGRGDARAAVAKLGRARALARHADGHTRAWLSISFVEEAADFGDVGLCEATLEAAQRALDTAIGHDGGFFSPQARLGRLALYLARVQGRLASLARRTDEAERFLSDELAGAVDARRRVSTLCALGTVRIEGDDPEGTCAVLDSAIDNALTQGCTGKVARIQAVRLRMPPAWNGLDCVVDLDERLRASA